MKAAKFDPIELLKLMKVVANEEECEKTIEVVVDVALSDTNELLKELSEPEIRAFTSSIKKSLFCLRNPDDIWLPEGLFFSSVICRAKALASLTISQRQEILDQVNPDIPVLCEVFRNRAACLLEAIGRGDKEKEGLETFICLQLLSLAKECGLQEEGSRRHFSTVMQRMLLSEETPDDLIEGCVEALRVASEDDGSFTEKILVILSELYIETEETTRLQRILAILSIVLENITPKLLSSHTLEKFKDFILPAVTHSDLLVREAAVSCFGKLGLFSTEEIVLSELKPLFFNISSNEKEKVEIRGQALLALSDWSMLFTKVLQPCVVDGHPISFLDLVRKMMDHPVPGVAAIAAEVAAKILFSGSICDSSLIAQLLVFFFNPVMSENDGDNASIKEVGSPMRLQQLLSLFFPAYCIKSESGRDAMLGSISCMLELSYNRPKTKKRKGAIPVIKMIDYVCSVVDAGRKASEAGTGSSPRLLPSEDEPSEDHKVSSSTAVLSSIQIAQFLIKESSNLTNASVRILCKFLGQLEIEVKQEKMAHLIQLKGFMEELGMILTDDSSLRCLQALNRLLVDVDLDNDGSFDEGSEDESDRTETDDEVEKELRSEDETTLEDSVMDSLAALTVDDKENSRVSSTPAKGKYTKRGSRGNRRSRTSSGSLSILETLG